MMTDTWISLDHSVVSGALMIRLQKLRTIEAQTRASESKTPAAESLLTALFCRCAATATGMVPTRNIKLLRVLFGKAATLFYGRSISTQSVETTRKLKISCRGKRHFGFSGEH